ncbi:MAG TPA: Ig-like domain-containing protein [Mycobacteriales bacterium]|nr:Ig-like domain-containing protein [Mycobacteriales bacterium]
MSVLRPVRATAVVASAALLLGAAPLLGTAAAAVTAISESPKAGTATFVSPATVSVTFDKSPTSATISVSRGGQAVTACSTSQSRSGATISCNPGTLVDGTYDVSANGRDGTTDLVGTTHAFSFTVATARSIDVVPAKVTQTNVTAVPVSGSFAAAETVVLTATGGGKSIEPKSVPVTSGGFSTTLDLSGLPEGTVTVTGTATDPNGGKKDTFDTAVKDTVGPSVVSTSPVADGRVQPGTAEAPFSPSVTFDAALSGGQLTLRDSAGSRFAGTTERKDRTLTFVQEGGKLREGAYTLSWTGIDTDGNATTSSAPLAFVVDGTPPAAPSVTVPALVRDTLTATGAAEPGATVEVTVADAATPAKLARSSGVADGAGRYSVDVPVGPLGQGALSVTATATDAAGNTSPASAPRTATKDTVAPARPGVAFTPSAVNAASARSVNVAGAAEEGSTVRLTLNDATSNPASTPIAREGKAGADGYSFAGIDVSSLSDGTLTATVTATDAAGNTSAVGTATAAKDTNAPDVTGFAVSPAKLNKAGTTVTATGSSEQGATVALTAIDRNGKKVTETAHGSPFSSQLALAELADGPITVTAAATDAAGNLGPAVTKTVEKDTVAPSVTVTAPTSTSANEKSYVVTGSTEAGASVRVVVKDAAGKVVEKTVAAGATGYTTGPLDVSGLGQGTLTVTATATDGFDNSTVAGTSALRDSVAPPAPSLAVTPNPIVLKDGKAVGTLAGAAAKGSEPDVTALTVRLSVTTGSGTPVTASVRPAADGSYTADVDVTRLADGPLTSTAVVEDAVGNVGPAATATVEKNTVALALLSTSPAKDASVQAVEVFTATLNERLSLAGSSGVITNRNGTRIAQDAKSLSSDERTLRLTPSEPLAEAGSPYTVAFTAVDRVGESVTGSITFVVDETAPPAPVLSAFGPVNAKGVKSVTVSGTAEKAARVALTVAGASGAPIAGTTTADDKGAWSTTLDLSALPDGQLTATATATDAAGNVSPAGTRSGVKDTVAPALTATATNITATAASSTVSGTTDATLPLDIVVTDSAGGVKKASATASAGSFSTAVGKDGLAEGPFTVLVTARDAAGNVTERTASAVKDTVAPTLTAQATDVTGSATSTTVSGTTDASLVEISVKDSAAKTRTASPKADDKGAYSAVVDTTDLAEGPLTVTVRVRDAVGNLTERTLTKVKDTIAPALTVQATDIAVGAAGTTVTGSTDSSVPVTVEVTDAAGVVRTAQVTSAKDGAYTASFSRDLLADGPFTVLVRVKDAAGNTTEREGSAVKQFATSLTLTAPATTVSGTATTLTGSLTRTGAGGVSGQVVTLTVTDKGGSTTRNATTGDGGAFSFEVTPTHDTTWTVAYAGGRQDAASTATMSTVVAAKVTATVTGRYAYKTVTGTVGPDKDGTTVTLQRVGANGVMTPVAAGVVKDGAYRLRTWLPAGEYVVTVPAAGGNGAGSSPSLTTRLGRGVAVADSAREDILAVIGSDAQVWARSSKASGWTPLGGALVDAPVVVAGYDESYVVGVGRDRNVWIRGFSTSAGWRPLGPAGTNCAAPSAVVSGSTFAVVCRGGDGALWVAKTAVSGTRIPAVTSWSSMGGGFRFGPSVSDVSPNGFTADFLYSGVGNDGRIWSRTEDTGWTPLAAPRCGGISTASEFFEAVSCRNDATSALKTFAGYTSNDGRVIPSAIVGRPAVAVDADGVARHYVLGTDSALYTARQAADGTTGGFSRISGAGAHGLSAVSVSSTGTDRSAGMALPRPKKVR